MKVPVPVPEPDYLQTAKKLAQWVTEQTWSKNDAMNPRLPNT
jgi:hypothetical protein